MNCYYVEVKNFKIIINNKNINHKDYSYLQFYEFN